MVSSLIYTKLETKQKLDSIKLCHDESYNSVIERLLVAYKDVQMIHECAKKL